MERMYAGNKKVITWNVFKEELHIKYIPDVVKGMKATKFINLRQDNMSVVDYERSSLNSPNTHQIWQGLIKRNKKSFQEGLTP